MAYDHPVQNSEVYLPSSAPHTCLPPPSPPSPATPCDEHPSPLDDLMPLTPPEMQKGFPSFDQRLSRAVHVLATEATSLSSLTLLYDTDPAARDAFSKAVEAIKRSHGERGKLVICGVGKSGYIAQKLVASMLSLGIQAHYLHPSEALHGDLGVVTKYDTVLLITFSGKTEELLTLLNHLESSIPMIVLTGNTNKSTCEIARKRPNTILLPAPTFESEKVSFGVSAPTTSTTMAMALGDALVIATAEELHVNLAAVFAKNHPGGAIGASFQVSPKVSDLAICLADMPDLGKGPSTGADVLISAYGSESGWVRCGTDQVVPPRCIKQLEKCDMDSPTTKIDGLMIPSADWIRVPAEMEVTVAKERYGTLEHSDDTILAIMDDYELIGVLQAGDLA